MDRKGFMERIFPAKYNFYGMLREQASLTSQGTETLLGWLKEPTRENYNLLINLAEKADTVRLDMEEKLIEAFTTPFDRQDIYYISVQMDRIIEYARSALLSMQEFSVRPDDTIIKMMHEMSRGTNEFAKSVALLEKNPAQSQQSIKIIRDSQTAVEEYYRRGMSDLFKTTDTMEALKLHEIYSLLKDAATSLGFTVDIFHRIVVRLI